ncbi:hypothetical protein [Mucilaginibacter sp. dw_454]|uniref:hypothetical protein n=1 Tax=Mucilaginibacter sp. dw_454 TaxID=2720079 RepID=UPI001BD44E54|nr:hypothetical protein [Mucilaginibacter sp. dw_454]
MKNLNLKHPVAIISLHIFVVITAYLLCNAFLQGYAAPTNSNLQHYDVAYYYSIKNIGYLFLRGRANNLAFFPLFPYLWGLTTLNILFMGIFNCLLFSGSLYLLLKDSKLPGNILLFLLSFPSFLFFVIPYAEALFFFFSVFIILGYKRQSDLLLCIGLLGASMVRSTCVIFVPAIIICDVFEMYSLGFSKRRLLAMLYRIAASIAGFIAAAFWMAYYTHKWFYFVAVQKYWHRAWSLPRFPLTTIQASRVLSLDAIAFVLACIALFFCFMILIKLIKGQRTADSDAGLIIEKQVLFSILFIVGVTILDTGFTNKLKDGTNIWSLNRHMMCTAFSVSFILFLYQKYKPTRNELIGLVLIVLLGIYATGVFHYLKLTMFYLLFFVALSSLKFQFKLNKLFVLYYLFAVFLQISFYSDFLAYKWVG